MVNGTWRGADKVAVSLRGLKKGPRQEEGGVCVDEEGIGLLENGEARGGCIREASHIYSREDA